MATQTPQLTQQELEQFTGTEHYYFNPQYEKMQYTDGVKYFAEKAHAYWLLDIIGTEFFPKQEAGTWDYFIAIKLHVEKQAMTITVTDGNEKTYEVRTIDFTDFPAGDWQLWLVDGILILPSEY